MPNKKRILKMSQYVKGFVSKYEPRPRVPLCAPVCGAAGSLHPLVAIIRLNTELRPGPSKLRAMGKV